MHRAPVGPKLLLLLLMAGLAVLAGAGATTTTTTTSTPPLEVVNPWLSACDLQPASATDLQGACSATMWSQGALCPPPCSSSANSTQCLHYLEESHKDEV